MNKIIHKVTINSNRHPKWFTKHIRHLIKCCRSIRRSVTTWSTPSLVAKLERLQSVLQSEIKVAKQDYESYLIMQFALSRNPEIFHHIKRLTSWSQFPSQMYLESTIATSDRDKATLLNNYFFSVFLSNSVVLPSSETPPPPTSSVGDISLSEVYSALTTLDACKAVGPKVLCCSAVWTYPPSISYLTQDPETSLTVAAT